MPEAVIVDAVRTPIGRAFKGSLAQLRPDEMGAFVVDALLDETPSGPELVEDVCRRGLPRASELHIGRIIGLLRGCPTPHRHDGPRYCASPHHPHRRHRSRPARATPHRRGRRALSPLPLERTASQLMGAILATPPRVKVRFPSRVQNGVDGRGRTNATSRGRHCENVAAATRAARRHDRYPRSQERGRGPHSAFFDREIVSASFPTWRQVARTTAAPTRPSRAPLKPSSVRRSRDRRPSCPLNSARGVIRCPTARQPARLSRARGSSPRDSGLDPRHGVARSRDQECPRACRGDRDVDIIELTEAFAAQSSDRRKSAID